MRELLPRCQKLDANLARQRTMYIRSPLVSATSCSRLTEV